MKPTDGRHQAALGRLRSLSCWSSLGSSRFSSVFCCRRCRRRRLKANSLPVSRISVKILQAMVMYVGENRSTFPNARNFNWETQQYYPKLDPATNLPSPNSNPTVTYIQDNDYIQDFLSSYLHYLIVNNNNPTTPGPTDPTDKGPVNLVWRCPALQSGNYGEPFMEDPGGNALSLQFGIRLRLQNPPRHLFLNRNVILR